MMITQNFKITAFAKHKLGIKQSAIFFSISDADYSEIKRRVIKIRDEFEKDCKEIYGKDFQKTFLRNLK